MQMLRQHKHKPRGRNAAHTRRQLRAAEATSWRAEASVDAAHWRRELVQP